VVTPAAVVVALVAAVVVPALLAAALDAAAEADADVRSADAGSEAEGSVPGVCDALEATSADGSPEASDVGSVATDGTPAAVAPPNVAADHAAARMLADVATAATLPRALTRRTFRCGSRSGAYRPPAHRR
jgi:hypothetical protein